MKKLINSRGLLKVGIQDYQGARTDYDNRYWNYPASSGAYS
jgi:hypothetical protein